MNLHPSPDDQYREMPLTERAYELARFNVEWEGGTNITVRQIQEHAHSHPWFEPHEVFEDDFLDAIDRAYADVCNDWPYGMPEYGTCPNLINETLPNPKG